MEVHDGVGFGVTDAGEAGETRSNGALLTHRDLEDLDVEGRDGAHPGGGEPMGFGLDRGPGGVGLKADEDAARLVLTLRGWPLAGRDVLAEAGGLHRARLLQQGRGDESDAGEDGPGGRGRAFAHVWWRLPVSRQVQGSSGKDTELSITEYDTVMTLQPHRPVLDPHVEGGEASQSPLPQILVPLDGSSVSEQVLPIVTMLARGLGSRVALLRVLETDALPTTLDPDQQLKLDQLVAQAQERSLEYLQSLQARLQGDGVEATTDVLPGSPAEAIVFLAHSLGADLIAMCTHGRSGLERLIWGSVAEKVLQTADCGLLLVRAGEQVSGEIGRVLLPLDGSDIAERATPMAQMLAGAFGVPLALVRVVPTTEVFLAGWDADGIVAADLLTSMEEEAAGYLESTASAMRRSGMSVETQVVRGDPATVLGELASAERMVVMATHGRTGPGRYVMGSVAEKVVRGAWGPVLVVR